MKNNLLKSALLLMVATFSLTLMATDFEIDLRQAPLGYGDSFSAKYLVVGNPYTYTIEKPENYDAFFEANRFNESAPSNSAHGYVNLKVTIPVVAGNYKVTLGSCQYGTGTGSIKNASGTVTYANFDQKLANCYHQDVTNNVVIATFSVAAIDTIKIICGNYTPYIKFEKLANIEYTVTFTKGEDVEGILPGIASVIKDQSLAIPVNHTLYKDGYTLTGWNDGENTYAIGANYTPTKDVTMTPVFTENTGSIVTATSEVTVQWNFGLTEGAPSVGWQGRTGDFIVAQASVGGNPMDVKLIIDTKKGGNNGKFYNIDRTDFYAQVNANTIFTFPSKKDASVEVYTYADPATSTLDGNKKTGAWSDKKAIFKTSNISGTSVFEVKDGSYYRYLKVTYPASSTTAIENQMADGACQNGKILRNGQLLIIRDGKTYTITGQEL